MFLEGRNVVLTTKVLVDEVAGGAGIQEGKSGDGFG